MRIRKHSLLPAVAAAAGFVLLLAAVCTAGQPQIVQSPGAVVVAQAGVESLQTSQGGLLFATGEAPAVRQAVLLSLDSEASSAVWWVIAPGGGFGVPAVEPGGRRAVLLPEAEGRYLVIVAVLSDGALQQAQAVVEVGNIDPPPQPGKAPWPSPGLTVLILRESQSTGSLPAEQRAIMASAEVHEWLTANCAKLPDQAPGYRIWDDDYADVANAPVVMQLAFKAVKEKMQDDRPMLGISNGRTGTIMPLPGSVNEFLAVVEKYK